MFPINVLPNVPTPSATDRSVQPATPVQSLIDQLADLVPGQRVLAQVQSALGDGVYRAMVSQREVTLALPFAAKAGDQLELEVVSRQGKTMLATVLPDAGDPPPSDSTPLHLSPAGKTIGDLIRHYQQSDSPAPLPLKANQPLVTTAETAPLLATQLAPALQQAVEQSGVFYEAHLARWVNGSYPEALLRQEPQAQQTQTPTSSPSSPAPTEGDAPPLAQPTTAPATSRQTAAQEAVQQQISSSTTPLDKGNEANAAKPLIPATLSHIVEQQLATLDQSTVLWQGQAWPGQRMEWEIQRDAPEREGSAASLASPWRSKLTLHLPHLGTVEAILHLDSQRSLNVQLGVATTASQEMLEHGAEELRQHLSAAGLITTRLGITQLPTELPEKSLLPGTSSNG